LSTRHDSDRITAAARAPFLAADVPIHRRKESVTTFHPDLHRTARFIPRFSFTPRLVRCINFMARLRGIPRVPQIADVAIEDVYLRVAPGAAPLRVRLYRPRHAKQPLPAMLWLHGGGFLFGAPEFDQEHNIATARELGILIAAVDYRLAPAHPFPAPLEDAYGALKWLHAQAAALGVMPGRYAVAGSSAGGGLAAGLALLAHDRAEVPLAFQLLLYPMLDDRTVLRTDLDTSHLRMWDAASNRYGWTSYLGRVPGAQGVSDYAAPARRADLTGLPAAWIGTGTFDLFHDENCAYARRLSAAGVPCALRVVDGAYHGFDAISRKAQVSRDFRSSYLAALRDALEVAS
jgi:acetyl esterase/lipase